MMRLVCGPISTWPVASSPKNDLCHLRGFLYLDHHASDAHVLVCVHSDLFGHYRSPADQHDMTKRSIPLKQRYREQLKSVYVAK